MAEDDEIKELEWENCKLAEFAGRLMVRIREMAKPRAEPTIQHPSEMTGRKFPRIP